MSVIGTGLAVVNIVVADDHKAVRKGLRALLNSDPRFNVIGEATSGREAVDIVNKLHPHILVLDLMMPDMNGLEVTRRLSKECPETDILILSMHSDKAYILEALRCGAKGYILKESPPEEILVAIHAMVEKKLF